MKPTVYARMSDFGQCCYKIVLPWKKEAPVRKQIKITGDFFKVGAEKVIKKKTGLNTGDVLNISLDKNVLTLDVNEFCIRYAFSVKIGDETYTKEDFEIITDGLDKFGEFKKDDVVYRLYTPPMEGKHPLILYLHGGGNGGVADQRDNKTQLLADYGPINLTDDYPDCFLLAPQCKQLPPAEQAKMIGNMQNQSFFNSKDVPDTGWNREYLAKVCEIIREMIKDGRVDEKRVYVTGLSMGGAGTIRAMHVGADLFAAAAPICPTMTQETFNMLRTTNMPVWVSSAYVDHTVYRHKYLVDAVMELKDNGHKNAHLTLYAPEEFAKYNIAIDPTLSYKDRFSLNHMSWVLTYHNEYGIMSWLLNQRKD